jgi:hypothetical protein
LKNDLRQLAFTTHRIGRLSWGCIYTVSLLHPDLQFLEAMYEESLVQIDNEYQLAGYEQLLLSAPVDNVRNVVN